MQENQVLPSNMCSSIFLNRNEIRDLRNLCTRALGQKIRRGSLEERNALTLQCLLDSLLGAEECKISIKMNSSDNYL